MTSIVLNITPSMAAEYLKKNTSNREINANRVKMYAKEMKEGRWQLTHQGICFYEDGTLADGQHRLEGICLANVTVPMLVTWGLPNGTSMIDRVRPRSLANILQLEGLPSQLTRSEPVSCVRFMFNMANGRQSVSELVTADFIRDNHEILSKIRSIVDSGKSGHGKSGKRIAAKSCCYAAAFCAIYSGVPEDVVHRFFTVVNSGFASGEKETAAVVYRNMLLSLADGTNVHNTAAGVPLFSQCTRAINDFAAGSPRRMKYKDKEPLYWDPVKEYIKRNYLSD